MTDHSGRTHSLYSASTSGRWLKCHGSIQRAAGMPPGTSSDYAQDGEEAHEVLEYAIANGYVLAEEAKLMSGIDWTYRRDSEDERYESVQLALNHVRELLEAYQPDCQVFLETQFIFPTVDNDDAGGTADVIIYIPDLDQMIVADYKHGSGVSVDVAENPQLLFYAVGARQELRRQGYCMSNRTLYRMMIMQPRGFHKDGAMREWACDDTRLDKFIGEVNWAIDRSKDRVPTIQPGKYCRWCPAVAACPEAEQHRMKAILPTYNNMSGLKQSGLPAPTELSVERIGDILNMREMVEEWLDAVHAQAVALARQGVAIPDRKLVMAQAKTKWYGDDKEVAAGLSAISGLPPIVFLRQKLITITDAKQLIRNAIYQRVGHTSAKKAVEEANKAMAPLTIKDTSGNMVLVSRDDKRPEVNLAQSIPYHKA